MIAMRKKGVLGSRIYEPTPRDIRRECEYIQATWSLRERAKRTGNPRVSRWMPPTIRVSSIAEAVHDDSADAPLCWGGPVHETET
jgi:hypothetical protein